MKIGVQLNPQVSIGKPPESLMPTLIEQVRMADQSGYHAFSMGEHYNIPALQRVHQIPALARLCAEVKLRGRYCGNASWLRHPVTVLSCTLDVINNGRSFAAFGLGYRDEELNAFHLNKTQRFQRFVEVVEIIKSS
jgi:alkanesulfonate monooxygenase SsuD/methylene tetrahydromethanopterin reductase-like flavin-dependent oxidoreductase (luciferase family)